MNHQHNNHVHEHEAIQAHKQSNIVKFLPLITIFLVIITFTLWHNWGAWNTTALMHDFMGSFFLIFGAFKIFNLRGFVEAYQSYDFIAQRSKIYAYAYPFIEIALGIAYLTWWQPKITNIITLVLMLVSSAGVLRALLSKSQIVCACLGAVFAIPLTYVTLIEDILMAAMAAIMLFY